MIMTVFDVQAVMADLKQQRMLGERLDLQD